MYAFERNGGLVGYSEWTWDSIYFPVVGCFRSGRLVAWATCNLSEIPGFEGPSRRCWFRMTVDAEVLALLRAGDRSVHLMRLEDGASIAAQQPVTPERVRPVQIADILASAKTVSASGLSGFAAYLTAPIAHQIHVLFLDILNRPPDPEAAQAYGRSLERGAYIFDLRAELMRSAEFMDRGVSVSDRIGSLITSAIWNDLRQCEPLGEDRRRLQQLRLSDYAGMSSLDFVKRLHVHCHGDEPDEGAAARLARDSEHHGRAHVTHLLMRDAANGGNFLELVDG